MRSIVVVDAAHVGIGLYGGLDYMNGWTWTGDKSQVSGPSALYALRVAMADLGIQLFTSVSQLRDDFCRPLPQKGPRSSRWR
jgi:hypothetical protein